MDIQDGKEEKHKAPKDIRDLVERFERNLSDYKGKGYNEFQLRIDFINPFFKALGWDIGNKKGAAPAYRDVIFEDSIKIGGGTKAPDYCFTLSGRRKFFVETKKPSIKVKKDSKSSFQIRRYAWSSKLTLSILTNFEEFVIYEARQRPHVSDKPDVERIKSISYKEYIDKWDDIYSIFSYEAVLQGSFDKYAEAARKKRGTKEVDDEFLKEIEEWREKLAKNIAIRNTDLSVYELNYSVQRTIDRIIFLRMCEDKGIEKFDQLQSIAGKDNIYCNLCEIFKKADEKYNSGLFHFKKERDRNTLHDELTLKLNIDDNILRNIFRHLYYPNCPYEFSVISPEILGNVYEQFLGKIIRLTEGHRAKIEEKPEVKKAGGVYYTPQYIVDYIVENTVRTLIKGKAPKYISGLKILDPACGSGSFLLGAYSRLLQYHLDYYSNRKNSKLYKNQIYQGADGEWHLTIKEKKRILLNNIFGVDIDSQAVEVTKLSLLLKVLEGESKDFFEKQQKLWIERALPDLSDNIKCGNSLIGPNFLIGGTQIRLSDEQKIYEINAFDWNKEFKPIMEKGGFDVVIGNPPYGYLFDNEEEMFLKNNLKVFAKIPDAYVAFIEKAHNLLNKSGKFGYIIPSAWLGGPRYNKLRNYLLEFKINSIIALPFDIFKDAYIDTLLITTINEASNDDHCVITYEYPKREKISSIETSKLKTQRFKQSMWKKTNDCKFVLDIEMLSIMNGVRKKIKETLETTTIMKRGVLFNKDLLTGRKISDKSHPYFEGDVYRYQLNYFAPKWVEYGSEMKEYPKEFHWFTGERILLRRLVNRQRRLMATTTNKTVITNKNLYSIKKVGEESLEYVLGILNSKLFSRLYLSQVSQATKDDFPQVTIRDILSLPYRKIDFNNPKDKQRYDKIVDLVKNLIYFKDILSKEKTDLKKTQIERQLYAIDNQIDQIVCDLYGLSEKQKRIIGAY